MSDRFIRSRALFGDEAFEKLKNSRVAVFGLAASELRSRSSRPKRNRRARRHRPRLYRRVQHKQTAFGSVLFGRTEKDANGSQKTQRNQSGVDCLRARAVLLPGERRRNRPETIRRRCRRNRFFPRQAGACFKKPRRGRKTCELHGNRQENRSLPNQGFGHIRNVRVPFGAKMRAELKKRRRKRANGNLVARAARARAGLRTKLGRKKIHTERSSRACGCGLYLADAIIKYLLSDKSKA